MRKFISIFLLLCFVQISAFAVDFDSSIDEKIRKNYDVEINDLPALPQAEPSSSYTQNEPFQAINVKYNPTGKVYTIKGGTKVNIVSKSKITDWTSIGTKVSFYAKEGFTTKEGSIIPAGTIFKGTITDVHRPQITGNGGLVELKIDEIYYNGVMSKIETTISIANSKKVFLGNIKGKRLYLKNISKVSKPGKKAFQATHKCASELGNIYIINILSPIVWLCGACIYAVNAAAAPVIAIFTKGGELILPAGTMFVIKITEDSKIYG